MECCYSNFLRGGKASVSPVGTPQGFLQQYHDPCVQYSVGMWLCCSVCAWWQLSLCPECPCALLAGPITTRTARTRKEDWPSKRGCFWGNHLQKGLGLGSGGWHPNVGDRLREVMAQQLLIWLRFLCSTLGQYNLANSKSKALINLFSNRVNLVSSVWYLR